jgi:hypothetical protein
MASTTATFWTRPSSRTRWTRASDESLGATPVVSDVFDADALLDAVSAFAPDLVMHQLTGLPDEIDKIPGFSARNNRMRTEGTAVSWLRQLDAVVNLWA